MEPSRENPDRSLKPSPLDKPGFIEVSGQSLEDRKRG
jgi:hypothetical protein